MPKYQKVTLLLIFGVLLFAYNDCGKVQFSNSSAAALGATGAGVPTGPVVCNPFGSGGGGTASNGLVASQIRYLGSDQIDSNNNPIPSIASFNNLWSVADGIFDLTLILDNIDTPNRYFTEGFADGTNPPLTAGVGGATLIQFFGFQLKSNFVLGNLPAGPYQLAVLSDDGSNLTISGGQSGGSDFVINNDGTHSMKMGCFNGANQSTPPVLNLNSSSKYPMEFDYYQGPRVTIGLMLMYRPMPPGNPVDAQCGQGGQGDGYFFVDNDGHGNPISPSTPTAAFNSLLTEQYPWTVVPATNYVLPSSNSVNPCD